MTTTNNRRNARGCHEINGGSLFFDRRSSMVLRVPYYYNEFRCLANHCKDSCCIGWEIDIDPDTYEYYNTIKGEFGKKLKENIRAGREPSFRLKEGRCPFLDGNNLCEICTELGEESLCETCTEYPRFTLEYADVKEKCLALSCEEAGRLIFAQDNKCTIKETYLPVVYDEDYENKELIPRLEKVRDHAIAIMQERALSIPERICFLLQFSEEVQADIAANDLVGYECIIGEYEKEQLRRKAEEAREMKQEYSAKRIFLLFERRMEVFDQLEVFDEEWRGTPKRIKQRFLTEGATGYQKALHEFTEEYKAREYEYEHLMVYFIFRYGMKSAFDRDFLSKVRFGIASFLMIRDMDLERFLRNGRVFTLEDRIDVARIYSKEVEHSEENLEQLSEAFAGEELFELYEIFTQLLA